ncbi:DnaJ-class molecular chaperone [Evansella vedderi]|uniref:DnaJ-class molecular chaperone n=1 Tax=Evansella vedderi TaxID=38282 RepID=A0ABU0A3R7_9BACI|nr:YuiA family protein [Evansella vedderi]MDQ0257652.1 DnaJ-class molecular chaperone [Evansella vedderi]
MALRKQKLKSGDCPYCIGKGYFQLLLGGSETCNSCNGSGRKTTNT